MQEVDLTLGENQKDENLINVDFTSNGSDSPDLSPDLPPDLPGDILEFK